MANDTYDIITVGGGLGGAALAKAMAAQGVRVLVLEREKQFKDRIRGEFFVPWGVAETQALGLYDLLLNTCAHESVRFCFSTGPEVGESRDLISTLPHQLPSFTFHHPAMQKVLLQAAVDAGAEVRRGASVRDVRVLRDKLLSHENWDEAGHAYAEEHDRHYGVIHTVNNWLSEMFFEIGPEGEARRARALPLIAQDPTRVPDHVVGGPELPADETVRRRFFGEE